ncbi:DUF397 domain-containing protein [Streptomyces sp. H27-D2]|uniref:DUF397 domain-containing protein n=1 Tax=Streptomyces sp. H27-D2 TaxID=3046304 RepID=UPI002DB869D3|nr:DUF397 domain-containing protein [Streptomyces sp. H27-D2]MEC4018130.1 DUF397 domain-containing protein [Streptomyces sp. H27-D2]
MENRQHAGGNGPWFKSSYSGGSGTECVEAAFRSGGASVRDSKDRRGPMLDFSSEAWRTFVNAIRNAHIV